MTSEVLIVNGILEGMSHSVLSAFRYRYHHFLTYERNSIARDALFQDISPNLHLELRLILFVQLIKTAPFFDTLRTSAVGAVVLGFDEIVVCPGDIIIRKGAAGKEMFFILKGQCEVCGNADGILSITFLSGSH